MKRVYAFLTVLIMLSAFLPLPTSASEEKVHTVKSAHFEVFLNEDGSADITETWVVNFVSGDFSRFRKEIYTKVSGEEAFSSVTNVSVRIDGEECEESQTDGFNCEETDSTFIIYANRKSRNVTRTYQFSYTLTDVVKKRNETVSVFCYRFVGKNHPLTIDTLSVTITAPCSGSFHTEYITSGSSTGTGSVIEYVTYKSTGLYKIQAKFISDQSFGVSYTEDAKAEDGSDGLFGVVFLFFGFLIFGLPVLLSVLYNRSNRKEAEKRRETAIAHPEQMEELLATLEEKLVPSQIVSIYINGGGSVKMLTVILAELILSGHILLSEDKTQITLTGKSTDDIWDYQEEYLALVRDCYCKYANTKVIPEDNTMPLRYLTSYTVSHAHAYRNRFLRIRSNLGWKNIMEYNALTVNLQEPAKMLLPHLQIKNTNRSPFLSCLTAAKTGSWIP